MSYELIINHPLVIADSRWLQLIDEHDEAHDNPVVQVKLIRLMGVLLRPWLLGRITLPVGNETLTADTNFEAQLGLYWGCRSSRQVRRLVMLWISRVEIFARWSAL